MAVRKKVDERVRSLLQHCSATGERGLLVLVGDHGKDQVSNLHMLLNKTRVRRKPSVLWCYKKDLGFSTHRVKRMRQIKKNIARGLHDPNTDDAFELFIGTTEIRWCYYRDTHKVLGNTFGMCVLQDFEAVTPNILARTIETVEGGGLVILLLRSVQSLKQLYSLTMDVHAKFRTEGAGEVVVPRFNERFILSLADCRNCLVLDDELNILPISRNVSTLALGAAETSVDNRAWGDVVAEDPELTTVKSSMIDTPVVGGLVQLAKTLDQARAVLSFLEALSERNVDSTVVLTASRGRGKSAAIGICLAGAVAYGYSNIGVTAPSPENLGTVFEFVIKGLEAVKYTEHVDFEVNRGSLRDMNHAVLSIQIFREHRQRISYFAPHESARAAACELVAIDEAAAIPLPVVKALLGNHLVFMSSTINGYEGTGRSLSLKLVNQLREQQNSSRVQHQHQQQLHLHGGDNGGDAGAQSHVRGQTLRELALSTPIRYAANDPVEDWLFKLLCMDIEKHGSRLIHGLPAPRDCELYYVNRDALFSYHALSEAFLQRIMALYTSAHYKNQPNDLQLLSDAPGHHIFALLGPSASQNAVAGPDGSVRLPDVFCVIQVSSEGRIMRSTAQQSLSRGQRPSGDLIPWTVSQQFNDPEFAGLAGARIVRVATHPDAQKMGYGTRAMQLLSEYFHGNIVGVSNPARSIASGSSTGGAGGKSESVDDDEEEDEDDEEGGKSGLRTEVVEPRSSTPPLLSPLEERPPEHLQWLGVSFGLTGDLLKFWSRLGYRVVYVRQTANDLTGEHTAIVLRECHMTGVDDGEGNSLAASTKKKSNKKKQDRKQVQPGWLGPFVLDARRRIVSLLGYSFRSFPTPLALTLVDPFRALLTKGGGGAAAAAAAAATGGTGEPQEGGPAVSASGHIGDSGPLTLGEVRFYFSVHDLKRLELYARNMVDHHMITDLLPALGRLVFTGRYARSGVTLNFLQAALLLGIGLQHRTIDDLIAELDLPVNQVLAYFKKVVHKLSGHLRRLQEADAAQELGVARSQGSGGGSREQKAPDIPDEDTNANEPVEGVDDSDGVDGPESEEVQQSKKKKDKKKKDKKKKDKKKKAKQQEVEAEAEAEADQEESEQDGSDEDEADDIGASQRALLQEVSAAIAPSQTPSSRDAITAGTGTGKKRRSKRGTPGQDDAELGLTMESAQRLAQLSSGKGKKKRKKRRTIA